MALIQQFRPATTVVWRVLRQGLDTGQRLLPVFGPGTPDIGSAEYYAERGYTPSGEKLESDLVGYASDIPVLGFIGPMPPPAPLIAEGRLQQYVPQGIAAILSSTQSGVGSSLPSKPKTPGKLKPSSKKFLSGYKPYAYKPKTGERCAPGYRWNQRDKMCVEL